MRQGSHIIILIAAISGMVLSSVTIHALALESGAPVAKQAGDSLDKYIFPLARAHKTPKVTIDLSETPDVRPWAERAQKLAQDWWPMLAPLLATDHFTPPTELKIVFKEKLDVPAYSSGCTIAVQAPWIRAYPHEFGVVIHEMVHVIQHYPGNGNTPGWLVEGIADYIRWWRYEPEARRIPIDTEKASYRDSYQTAACFLAWITIKYDHSLVRKLDASVRDRNYKDEIFKELTSKTVDELWTEFIATLSKRT